VKFHGRRARLYNILNVDLTGSFCCEFEFCICPVIVKLLQNKIEITFLDITNSIVPVNLQHL